MWASHFTSYVYICINTCTCVPIYIYTHTYTLPHASNWSQSRLLTHCRHNSSPPLHGECKKCWKVKIKMLLYNTIVCVSTVLTLLVLFEWWIQNTATRWYGELFPTDAVGLWLKTLCVWLFGQDPGDVRWRSKATTHEDHFLSSKNWRAKFEGGIFDLIELAIVKTCYSYQCCWTDWQMTDWPIIAMWHFAPLTLSLLSNNVG